MARKPSCPGLLSSALKLTRTWASCQAFRFQRAVRPARIRPSSRFLRAPTAQTKAASGGEWLAVRLYLPCACGYSRLLEGAVVSWALRGASCRPGGRPSGQPAAFDEAPAGCEEAQARRERGLFEPAKRASSGPSARKTSQWLVFSEVGKASAFPRTIPVLPRRSDERSARAGEERAAGWPGRDSRTGKSAKGAAGEPLRVGGLP